jgi:hypothetical protein
VCDGRLAVDMSVENLGVLLGLATGKQQGNSFPFGIEFRLIRTGGAIRLVPNDRARAYPDDAEAAMMGFILPACKWRDRLAGGTIDIAPFAEQEGSDRT